VFNPGINALSVVTAMLREPLRVVDGIFEVPANQGAPIAAELKLESGSGIPVDAQFDWRKPGPPQWEITVATGSGEVRVTHGGARLWCDGIEHPVGPAREYPALYRRFAELIERRQCDVDLAPLRTVADAFLRCRVKTTEDFHVQAR
jgi:D-galactose 1-dehydrogenase